MKMITMMLTLVALGACSASHALAPVMDPAGLAAAAGLTSECIAAEEATVAPAFDVDWGDGDVTYGGGVFLGCGSYLYRFRCTQERDEDGRKKWVCEPLSRWTELVD